MSENHFSTHEHHHGCDCGHEHHHHCNCGCEHEHEHHSHNHGSDCDCGCHEHHHEHHHLEQAQGTDFINVAVHDLAVVGSYRISINASAGDVEDRVASFIKSIGDSVMDCGGVIGHIKAFVQIASRGLKMSMTDGELDIVRISADNAVIEGVAIVFGVEAGWLQSCLTEAGKILKN